MNPRDADRRDLKITTIAPEPGLDCVMIAVAKTAYLLVR